jgi:hypothetical protein
MSKAFKGWSQAELEAIATCLRDDLRTAGLQFSIEFTSPPAISQMITSVPPSDTPPDPPGSGGLIIEDFDVTGRGVDGLPPPVRHHMGFMHAQLGELAETAIVVKVNGVADMWLEFWSEPDQLEQLASSIDQVQDTVMETTHERWPKCPHHEHELRPEPAGDWVEWRCPGTDEAIARFGQLS